ncbi:MAG: hypothetical protein HQ593_02220 [Candidatus Omnitrophica bacterium]|nr:hypothetical protein [Candidatus Omnitrophota bacterium]
MGPVEALRLALSMEIEAVEKYSKFANEHSVARETFEFLADEENKHKVLLEKKIAEMTA